MGLGSGLGLQLGSGLGLGCREGLDRIDRGADVVLGRDGACAREAADEVDGLEAVHAEVGEVAKVGPEPVWSTAAALESAPRGARVSRGGTAALTGALGGPGWQWVALGGTGWQWVAMGGAAARLFVPDA